LLNDHSSQLIVESLIDLSRKLGMSVVAEGIESEAQAKRLRELGCNFGQGYYFARPSDTLSTTRLLRTSAQRHPRFDDKRSKFKFG
jgi:EAL domain-containing protein (putative c-di-GMP-specific phosphodiesterase class I)